MITKFEGKYSFLSNFYLSPIIVYGEHYPSVEHAFQALKSSNIDDRNKIAKLADPAQAKKAGRKLPLRSDWKTVKVDVMRKCLKSKFSNPQLRQMLLDTGDEELVEGNTWNDTFWGVCRGQGQNMLGKLLMEIREELR